jgi:response regulator of citrate/malate metabolism
MTEEIQKSNKIVLVVEDDLALQFAIKKKLELNGFMVLTARSVAEARAHLEKNKVIDAIWLDHYLLGPEDGLNLVDYLKKENSPWKKTPLFVVSNTATPEKVQTYIRYGVTKYYVKANCSLVQIITDLKHYLESGSLA